MPARGRQPDPARARRSMRQLRDRQRAAVRRCRAPRRRAARRSSAPSGSRTRLHALEPGVRRRADRRLARRCCRRAPRVSSAAWPQVNTGIATKPAPNTASSRSARWRRSAASSPPRRPWASAQPARRPARARACPPSAAARAGAAARRARRRRRRSPRPARHALEAEAVAAQDQRCAGSRLGGRALLQLPDDGRAQRAQRGLGFVTRVAQLGQVERAGGGALGQVQVGGVERPRAGRAAGAARAPARSRRPGTAPRAAHPAGGAGGRAGAPRRRRRPRGGAAW